MAVTLQSATRAHAAPCVNYTVTVLVDGTPRVFGVSANDLTDPLTADEAQTYLRLWARYQRAKGKTLAQMVGQTVIGDIP